jgi:hypothetical protein
VPLAVKDVVCPTVKLDGDEGLTVMEDNAAVVVAFEPQAAKPRVKDAINPIISKIPINRNCLFFILFFLL